MFLSLLLFLAYTNVAHVTNIEDILICANDTDCDESVGSATFTQGSKIDDSTDDSSNDTENDTLHTTIIPTDVTTSLKINSNVTEQSELQPSTVRTTSSPITTPPKDSEILVLEKREICECDFIRSSCDVNCCCDVDCKPFHLSAFSHCQDHHADLYDSRYCYNRNFIQRNNTPFILKKLANNLFCILYDNLPSTYNVDNDLVLQNERDLWRAIEMKKYTWKVENGETLSKYNLSKHYQHGDTLWKLHKKSIEPIEFLQTGFTGLCSFKKALKYLEDWKSACMQNELTNINRYLFSTTFSDFTIISSLPLFNETFIAEQICRSNICLPVRTHYCRNSFSTCNGTKIPGFCANSTCTNIVKGLKYVIGHNGSAGVNSIDAYFDMGDASRPFYQYFEVRHDWTDSNKSDVFVRSGNPGYVAGKPIIIGVSRVNDSNEILFNRTDGFLTLPLADKSGECGRIDRHTVAFDEDVKLRCSVKLSVENFTASSCAELQNLTMRLLTKDPSLNVTRRNGAYVSKLGNFTSKSTADWSRVAFDRIPQNVATAHAIGERILCAGLITSIRLNILYSILPKPKTLTNCKILGVGVTFGKEENVSWSKCTSKNCADILRVDILSYVNFHDVSKSSKRYFIDGSNLDVTSPHNLFYPFLNHSKRLEISNISIILIMYVALHSITST